jgi:selenide,water dikinase
VSDDAAVYRVSDDLAIVQTLDYFTPIVDDPYTYGAIAAANATSDIYAMGGRVVLALNIACMPAHMPAHMIAEIFRGGADKVREAGGVIAGGHTVDDPEPKFGMAVMGFVHPRHIATRAGARPGDRLLLTKPLGTGIITTAAKSDVAEADHFEAAVASMLQLNRIGSQVVERFDIKAMTDITGFSLLGHAQEMADHSGVALHIHSSSVPFLPGARDYAEAWLFPGGSNRNRDYYSQWVRPGPNVSEELLMLKSKLDAAAAFLAQSDQQYWIIGEVDAGQGLLVD